MAFSITAEMPLGTYRGRGADGRVDRIPSVSRLHSALLCAAGFGPRAQPRGDQLAPCAADDAALRWLEDNPPDSVTIPPLQVNVGRVTVWRDDGTLEGRSSAMSIRKLPKRPDSSVAVAGLFRWTWSQQPPRDVASALAALCPDVPSLGSTESPVRLTTSPASADQATHQLDREAGLFTGGGGEDIEIPLPGRVDELVSVHDSTVGRVPSVSKDRYSSSESSSSHVPPRDAVALARYSLRAAESSDVPWPEVLLIPLAESVPQRDRVRFCVAVHRALIRTIGYGAPSLITGVYPEGRGRPANRLAIHVVDASMPVEIPGSATSALALLIPEGAAAADLAALEFAVGALHSVRFAGRTIRVVGAPLGVAGSDFWRSSASVRSTAEAGSDLRLWRTSPAAVPDTRGRRDAPWTFTHAALLSIGFVWKARWGRLAGRGDERNQHIVDAVSAAGVAVVRAAPLHTNDVGRFVHSVNDHAVVRPYRAELWLGDLCGQRTVQAIGQSRHLGGGLLVPRDVPAAPEQDTTSERSGTAWT